MPNAANNFDVSSRNWSGSNGDITTRGGGLRVSGISENATFTSGIAYHVTTITTSPYTGLASDYIIDMNFPSGTSGTVILPSGLNNGTHFTLKDGSGFASGYNILVSGQPNIDGALTYNITQAYGVLRVYKSSNGWRII